MSMSMGEGDTGGRGGARTEGHVLDGAERLEHVPDIFFRGLVAEVADEERGSGGRLGDDFGPGGVRGGGLVEHGGPLAGDSYRRGFVGAQDRLGLCLVFEGGVGVSAVAIHRLH
jgi:hypothetical protein